MFEGQQIVRVVAFRKALDEFPEMQPAFDAIRANLSEAIREWNQVGPDAALFMADAWIAELFFTGYLEKTRRNDAGKFGKDK